MKTGSEKSTKALSDTISLYFFSFFLSWKNKTITLLTNQKKNPFITKTVLILMDIVREGQYLVVHGKDDHQLPEDGDEVQEEFHTLPSHTDCGRY